MKKLYPNFPSDGFSHQVLHHGNFSNVGTTPVSISDCAETLLPAKNL